MTEREAKLKIGVESTGDPGAVKEIKKDLDGVPKAAKQAAAGLADVKKNLPGSGADEATRKIAQAVEILTTSTDSAAQSAGLAAQAYEALGGSPTEFIGRANSALERGAILAADLQKQVDQMAEEAGEGLAGFADRAAKAQQRIGDLEDIVEELGADEVPHLVSELERLRKQFDTTFETGARKAAKLEAEIENTEDRLKRMKLEARKGSEGITDLGQAFELQFPRASKAAAGLLGSVVAFRTAFDGTRETIKFFREQFGVDIDGMVSETLRLESVGERILDYFQGVSDASGELLRNQRRIFENLGLEGLSSDTEKNAEIIAQHFRTIRKESDLTREFLGRIRMDPEVLLQQAREFVDGFKATMSTLGDDVDFDSLRQRYGPQLQQLVDDLIAAGERISPELAKIAQSFGIVPSAINEFLARFELDSTTLINAATQFTLDFNQAMELNPQLNLKEFSEAAKSEIQGILDGLLATGQQIDPAFQAIADRLGIVPSRLEEISSRAAQIMSSLPGQIKGTREQLELEAEALKEVLSNLGGKQKIFALDPEQKAAIKEQLEDVIDTYRAFGEKIDPVIASHAQHLGILVGQWEVASKTAEDSVDQMSEAGKRLQGDVTAATEGVSQGLVSIETAAQQAADAMDKSALAQQKSISTVVTEIDAAGKVFITHKTVTKEAAEAMTLPEIEKASPRLRAYALAVQDAQAEMLLGRDAAGEMAASIKDGAEKSAQTAKDFDELAKSQEALGESSRSAAEAAADQAESLKAIADADVAKVAKDLSELDFRTTYEDLFKIVQLIAEIIKTAPDATAALEDLAAAGGEDEPPPAAEPAAEEAA